jgi:uncharacterized membrane protein (UPF0182 family)
VKTKAKEFDYPKGDENVYSTYAGNGGMPVSSLWRRILFSIKYSNMQILLTTNFTSESRIMINRNIQERVNKVAPFLGYDKDPYMVISKEGKLFWIQDAYTISSSYPYSTPVKGGYFIKGKVLENNHATFDEVNLGTSEDAAEVAKILKSAGIMGMVGVWEIYLPTGQLYARGTISYNTELSTYKLDNNWVLLNKEEALTE